MIRIEEHTCRECGGRLHTHRDVMIEKLIHKLKAFHRPYFFEDERIFLSAVLNGILNQRGGQSS